MMGYAIIDNATLTAVQRLLGEIPIYNKHAIDGDILAFETLIQSILFFDEVCYINDYKEEYREERNHYFSHLGQINIDNESYEALLKNAAVFSNDVIPKVEGGFFTDSDFKPFFELLKMHNIFTWDLASSIYYLTQKMLVDFNNEIDIDKYSKLNQMIFNEMNDRFAKQSVNKPIILDSKGIPIRDSYIVCDKSGYDKEAHIGKQAELLMANLSWLAHRTIFYTLLAKETGGSLVLHPIRNAFQINFLNKLYPQSNNVFRSLISSINSPVQNTVKAILEPTQPLISKLPLPMFSIVLTSKAGNPKEAINAAYHLKNERDFVKARELFSEIESLFNNGNPQKARIESNKLVLQIKNLMDRICVKYGVASPQGISISPMITAYNMSSVLTGGILPPIPNFSAKIKLLDKVKNWVPQKGFNSVYKSLINDLTQISQLGAYHELLTSQIVLHENASFYSSKEENSRFMRAKSSWKIPM